MHSYPNNPAKTSAPIHELISNRWSPLAFSSEEIEEEKITSLFEAMRWAPSSFNGQPWRIIYATQSNPEEFENMASLLLEGNSWSKNAYMLLHICALKNFEYNGKPNRHHQYDTGAAIENLFLQANSMGLVAHEMAGYDQEKAYEVLGIPAESAVSMAMMAVGYPGKVQDLSEDLQERQNASRERKPVDELVFLGKWKG